MPRTIPDNEHLKFNQPSTWVALFEITLDDGTHYLTPNPEEIEVDGNTYVPFPIMLEELQEDSSGQVSTMRLLISNIEGVLSNKFKTSREVEGYSVIFKQYSIENDAIIYEETLEIIGIEDISEQAIALSVGIFNPFLAKLLHEKFITDFCWNRYKGKGCWIQKSDGTYIQPAGFTAGNPDTCNHDRADCKRHGNVLRLNSFPGIPGGVGYV
jgi:phage-related protein